MVTEIGTKNEGLLDMVVLLLLKINQHQRRLLSAVVKITWQWLAFTSSGSQFLEPDGMFPNHIPNPEDKAAMKFITQAVLDNKADLGIIFNTNVERSAAVDSTGREFNCNRLITLMFSIVLEEHPGTTIVTDSVTSDGEESHLDIETSGHGALKGNHWLDDGAYLMVKVLNKLASARAFGSVSGSKVLTDLVEGLEEPRVSIELRFKINQRHADVKGGLKL